MFYRIENVVKHNFEIQANRRGIVIYSLAYLSWMASAKIDLNYIQNNGNFPEELYKTREYEKNKFEHEGFIPDLVKFIREFIKDSDPGIGLQQWNKRKNLWDKLIEAQRPNTILKIPDILIDKRNISNEKTNGLIKIKTSKKDKNNIDKCAELGSEFWYEISSWAKGNKELLQSHQTSMAYTIGKSINRNREVSSKLAANGIVIIEEANRKGFKFEPTK